MSYGAAAVFFFFVMECKYEDFVKLGENIIGSVLIFVRGVGKYGVDDIDYK